MYAYHSENHGFLLKDYTNGDFNESFFDHEYLLYDYPDALDAFPINRKVKCSPLPNALTPCDDLLEHWWLRLFVWLFMIVAIGANVVVLFVTLRSPQKSTHAHVLVIFLAIADFSLGLYLAFIAFVDASTRGEYAQLALEWRVSRSCEAAGFFAVFGSILSLWTLTAILLDRVLSVTVRCYTISKRRAWIAMSVGVAVAVTVAVLPLVGVSRYTDVGVCLPFDISTNAAKSYVTFLLVLPIVAISVITVSYVMVYCTYRRSGMKNAVCEMRVAFRVALLVIFNCACWLPIAVIGLLVIYGDRDHIVHASSLEGHDSGKISMFVAKVLVAIFFPINAVFDPFFYVISTPFFWRHMTGLLKKFRVRFRSGNNSNTLATTTGVETTIIDVTDPESDGQQTHTSNIPTVMVISTSV
jgi:thyroid stimulating hormone receptor